MKDQIIVLADGTILEYQRDGSVLMTTEFGTFEVRSVNEVAW